MQFRWKDTSTQSELKFELRGPVIGKGQRSMVCLLFFLDPSSHSLASSSRLWAGEKRLRKIRGQLFNHVRKHDFLSSPVVPSSSSIQMLAFLWSIFVGSSERSPQCTILTVGEAFSREPILDSSMPLTHLLDSTCPATQHMVSYL